MSEDKPPTTHMDIIEAVNAFTNMAKMMRTLYESLIEEGFNEDEALTLVGRYLHGNAGGKTT